MKFIIRDDDVNYHYQAADLKQWYSEIISICPISICIPAFVRGDFFHWCDVFESNTPYDVNEWLKDNKEYCIVSSSKTIQY